MQVLLIAAAGAVGALARYGVSRVAGPVGGAFPVATLLVNLSGAFALGFLGTYLFARTTLAPEWRLAITIGFLGAYTTFSTFSLETIELLEGGRWAMALGYVLASTGGGLFVAWAGRQLALA